MYIQILYHFRTFKASRNILKFFEHHQPMTILHINVDFDSENFATEVFGVIRLNPYENSTFLKFICKFRKTYILDLTVNHNTSISEIFYQ